MKPTLGIESLVADPPGRARPSSRRSCGTKRSGCPLQKSRLPSWNRCAVAGRCFSLAMAVARAMPAREAKSCGASAEFDECRIP